jgi:hypothetical protein
MAVHVREDGHDVAAAAGRAAVDDLDGEVVVPLWFTVWSSLPLVISPPKTAVWGSIFWYEPGVTTPCSHVPLLAW